MNLGLIMGLWKKFRGTIICGLNRTLTRRLIS
jgi:hypothetical protein